MEYEINKINKILWIVNIINKIIYAIDHNFDRFDTNRECYFAWPDLWKSINCNKIFLWGSRDAVDGVNL